MEAQPRGPVPSERRAVVTAGVLVALLVVTPAALVVFQIASHWRPSDPGGLADDFAGLAVLALVLSAALCLRLSLRALRTGKAGALVMAAALPWLLGAVAMAARAGGGWDAGGEVAGGLAAVLEARGGLGIASAWFLGATGFSLAVAALALPGTGRRFGRGALVALPGALFVGLAVRAAILAPPPGPELVVVVLLSALDTGALFLAGLALRPDGSGRAAAVGAAAAFALLLALVAGSSASADLFEGSALGALRYGSPHGLGSMIALREAGGTTGLARAAWLVLLLGAAVAAAAARTSDARPIDRGTVRLAGVPVAVAVLLALSGGLARHAAATAIARAPAGFAPAPIDGELEAPAPDLFLGERGVFDRDGKPIEEAKLPAALGALAQGPPRLPIDTRPWRERPRRGSAESPVSGPREEPAAAVSIDSRVTGTRLRGFIAAAMGAGLRSLDFIGPGVVREPGAVDDVERLPLVRAFLTRPRRGRVLLATALDAAAADGDPLLWHGTAGAGWPTLSPRAGPLADSWEAPRRIEDEKSGRRVAGAPVSYFRIDPAATAPAILLALDEARRAGFHPLLLAGDELPGHPERPAPVPVRLFVEDDDRYDGW